MTKRISQLPSLTAVESDDEVPLKEASSGNTKRATVDDLVAAILPPGIIAPYGGDSAPEGWLLCDGSDVSRATYARLFDAIGENYGDGDNSTTFTLPDLRQRLPLGKADSGTGDTLGETGGTIDHTHPLSNNGAAKVSVAATASYGVQIERITPDAGGASWSASHKAGTESAGGGSATPTHGAGLFGRTDESNPPYQVTNYIIKT